MAENKKTIVVTHVNIRQSISFLLLKLIFIDLLAAVFVLIFFSSIFAPQLTTEFKIEIVSLNKIYFGALFAIKTFLTIFVVLQWLNEYYEITANKIIYRRGVIWRREDRHEYEDIKSLKFQQGMLGKIFNYGTIDFYDWKERRFKTIYQVHNPHRYFKILEELIPKAEIEKKMIRERVFDEDE